MAQAAKETVSRFFDDRLEQADEQIFRAIAGELRRQCRGIELIASENIVSRAVLEAQGSVLTNKYAEGYPHKRYYGGCEYVDIVEDLAIERAKKLFDCRFANVQPNSGSQMNQAVFLALLQPGDVFMGLNLNAGGHLTHGSPVNISGKWFKPVSYGVSRADNRLDMAEIAALAHKYRPKLILAGGTAYSRFWDWAAFRRIADEVGACLMVDMAHIAGLVAGGVHPSPMPFAHVVTATTHKSLRGPRGGIILTNEENIAKKINMAVFPGLQGGPLMHIIAAKAVALKEALQPEFKLYAQNIVTNARVLAESLQANNVDIITSGTDNHLMLVDLRRKNITGKRAAAALERAGIICNKNSIPFDPESPFITSGLRLGTPAGTTRGFNAPEFRFIGEMIGEILDGLERAGHDEDNYAVEAAVSDKVLALTEKFPLYAF
ncbi:serine hydroxymethyltransferase [Candidatus Tokpelaia sp.]|uniref:serine hydroxymethyltransferase n=1 Tax=Candidatus Tokpelaia sp. TaxID=2233777 RepID=UPI001238B12C|nr:serine hydroxymethyltransferase [Candidatus Tokpelaia sp.]KAA6404893.1 serine hydroxymethyltransferase [Candidatus Tokpelaia sp.]